MRMLIHSLLNLILGVKYYFRLKTYFTIAVLVLFLLKRINTLKYISLTLHQNFRILMVK